MFVLQEPSVKLVGVTRGAAAAIERIVAVRGAGTERAGERREVGSFSWRRRRHISEAYRPCTRAIILYSPAWMRIEVNSIAR